MTDPTPTVAEAREALDRAEIIPSHHAACELLTTGTCECELVASDVAHAAISRALDALEQAQRDVERLRDDLELTTRLGRKHKTNSAFFGSAHLGGETVYADHCDDCRDAFATVAAFPLDAALAQRDGEK